MVTSLASPRRRTTAAIAGASALTLTLLASPVLAGDEHDGAGAVDLTLADEPVEIHEYLDEHLDAKDVELIQQDHTADIDENGEILYSEPSPMGPIPEPEIGPEVVDALAGQAALGILPSERSFTGETPEQTPQNAGAAVGDDPANFTGGATFVEAFSLNSRPGADHTIFLDFDGHVTTGQIWNDMAGVPDPLITGAYSRETNGNENESFSQLELDSIVAIWAQVVDDFAAWNVNVTTEDPGVEALRRTSANDDEYGIRVVITHDSEWYGPFGGVAYLFTFSREVDRPAFVFSDNLATGNPKSVGEAVSHEVGHTLGLRHDGHGSSAYYSGHGDWAPIMGVGYYRDITQWSAGDYPGANNTEDDLALIDAYLERIDNPGSPGSSIPSFGPGQTTSLHALTQGGSTATHQVALSTAGGITVEPVQDPSNLLADVTIRSGGAVVASSTGTVDGWGLSADLPAGTYTIEISSKGTGNTSTGFSAYGSMGQYRLSATGLDTNFEPPTGHDGDAPEPTGDPLPIETIAPTRVLDTRNDSGVERLAAGEQIEFQIAGVDGIPADATAAAVNVAAAGPDSIGWVSLTPCNEVAVEDRTSSVNFAPGGATANASIVSLSANGSMCAYASTGTHLVVDVTAVVSPSGSVGLASTTAERIVDSRIGQGVNSRLVGGQTVAVDFSGAIAPDTRAVAVNVTAVQPDGDGFVTVDDCSGAATTAALNVRPFENRGNNGVFRLDGESRLCVTPSVGMHLTIDLTGEFAPGGRDFLPKNPTRLLDTRESGSMVAPGGTTFTRVPTPAGVDLVAAASVNLTSVGHSTTGFVTAWDCGPQPVASALNPVPGQATANGALVEVGSGDAVCLFHAEGGHLLVDLTGWWV
ncbi:MAG: zinc-dependent metalloprotease family protein [Actinomycetota bacterium]